MPAQSPTLSPTLSAITAGLRGSSSGMPGLDLADEVGADVGGLRVDAAAEPGEDGDERAAEGEPDEVVDRRVRRVAEPAGEDPSSSPATPNRPSPTTRRPVTEPARNATLSAGGSPWRAASAVRTFERTATFIPMKPAAADRTAPMRKPIAVPQPSEW